MEMPFYKTWVEPYLSTMRSADCSIAGIYSNLKAEAWMRKPRGRVKGTEQEICDLAKCTTDQWVTFYMWATYQSTAQHSCAIRYESSLVTVEFKDLMKDDIEREQGRIRQSRYREKHRCAVTVTERSKDVRNKEEDYSANARHTYSSDFEGWWKKYPVHRNKARAGGYYDRLIADGVSPDDLQLAADNYVQDCARIGQDMLMHPANFLNPHTGSFEEYLTAPKCCGTCQQGETDAEDGARYCTTVSGTVNVKDEPCPEYEASVPGDLKGVME